MQASDSLRNQLSVKLVHRHTHIWYIKREWSHNLMTQNVSCICIATCPLVVTRLLTENHFYGNLTCAQTACTRLSSPPHESEPGLEDDVPNAKIALSSVWLPLWTAMHGCCLWAISTIALQDGGNVVLRLKPKACP